MAEATKQEPLRYEYNDGTVVIFNAKSPRDNSTISYTAVNTWYDGSPMNDSKVDSFGVFTKYKPTGEYLRQNLPNWGENFLEVDSVAQLRDLDPYFIHLIWVGFYKGVRLNGYYEKNDTPHSIEYFKSTTTDNDNGISIFDVGAIKMVHDFQGKIHIAFAGGKGDFKGSTSQPYTDNFNPIQNAVNIIGKGKLIFPRGSYGFSQQLVIPSIDGGTNSSEIIFETEGKLSSGGTMAQSSSGLVQLNFTGSTGSSAIISHSQQSWIDFNNIILVNNSGRSDVDGLVMKDYRSNRMSNFSIILFRDNLQVNGDTYYTVFDKCSFTHGKRYNVFLNGLANMTTFRECRISLCENVGFRAPKIGDGINIVDSFIEGNKGAGIHVNNCRLLNLKGTYIENNATVGGVLQDVRAQIIFGAYTNNINTPSKIVVEKNYIMGAGDGCEFLYAYHTNSDTIGNLCVSIIENTIPATLITKDITFDDRTHLVRCNYPRKLELALVRNKYSFTSKSKMYFPVNSRPSILASFYSEDDDCVTFIRPEWNRAIFAKGLEKGLSFNRISYVNPAVLGEGTNKDSAFEVDHDFPDLTTAGASLRYGRNTNTSGNIVQRWYDGTIEKASFWWKTGLFVLGRIGLNSSSTFSISGGIAKPEGNFSYDKGSIHLYSNTVEPVQGIYIKTSASDSNTGWKLIQPINVVAAENELPVGTLPKGYRVYADWLGGKLIFWNGTIWKDSNGIPISVKKIGTTAERPALGDVPDGFIFLDTTLVADGKPIFKSGTVWVDASGVAV